MPLRATITTVVAFLAIAIPARAQTTDLDDLVMYAIDADTHELIRYEFNSDSYVRIGVVVDQHGNTVSDIQSLSYMPYGPKMGLYGVSNFNESEPSRLVRINPLDASATALPVSTGFGQVNGLVGVIGSGAEAVEDFDIVNVEVVPADPYIPQITILGSAVTWDFGAYDAAVGVRYKIGGDSFEPYGPLGSPTGSNVNDHTNPREWTAPGTYAAGTPVSITARCWRLDEKWMDPDDDDNWWKFRTITSTNDTEFLIVLRDGDPIPAYDPWQDQATIEDFVKDYIDTATDTIKLQPNQVILLFELAAADFMDPATDFQDLVVLVTLGDDPAYFTSPGSFNFLASAGRSVKVNGSGNYPGDEGPTLFTLNPASGKGTAMSIGIEPYLGLGLAPDGTIYGADTSGDLWTVEPNFSDVYDSTETLIGSIDGAGNTGALEFAFGDAGTTVDVSSIAPVAWGADGALFGFDAGANVFVLIDPATGDTVEYARSFTSINFEGLVFLTQSTDGFGQITVRAND
jgi:hypothetical protein